MVFNPNLESGPTPESPVFSNVSAQSAGGMANVAAGALDVLGGFLEQAGERRQRRAATQLRQSFITGLEGVRARVDAGDINGASIAAGRAVSSYVAAGGVLDSETRAAATAISGLPENMFGVSQQALDAQAEQTRRANLLQDDQFNAYIFLEQQANPTMSDAETFAAAEARYNRRVANEALLGEAASTGQLNFEAGGRQAINEVIQDFTQSSLGSLIAAIDTGEVLDPRAVDEARIKFNGLRLEIERSLVNVSDSQRGEVTRQFEQVDNIINNIGTVLSSEGQTERLKSLTMQLMGIGPDSDYTPQQLMSALLASSDLTSFLTSGMGADQYWMTNPQNRADLMQSIELNLNEAARREAAAALPTQNDGTVNRNGVISYDQLPQTVRDQISELDENNLVSSMRVDGLLLGDVNATNITSPDMASRLVNRTYEMGAYMLSTEGRPLTPALVAQLGLGPNLAENLNVLEGIGLDDEGEALARITLRSGLSTQISAQTNYLNRVEQANAEAGLRWNAERGEYEITNRAFIEGFAQSVGMTADMMMEGGVVRLSAETFRDEGWRRQLRGRVGNIDEAFAYRESLGLLQGAYDSLRAEVPEDQGIRPTAFRLPEEVAADTDFLAATERVVGNLQSAGAQISADDLFRIIEFETAGTWSPSVQPIRADGTRISSATGLIQFLESTAQGLGTSTEALAQMTRAEQMEYVQRYLEPYAGRIQNFGDLYMAIHWPRGVGQGDDYVMYEEGSREYTANRGLDANGDGTVTRGETMSVVERRVGRGSGVASTPRTAAGQAELSAPIEEVLAPRRPVAPDVGVSVMAPVTPVVTEAPEVDMSAGDIEPVADQEAPARPAEPTPETQPSAEIARNLAGIARLSQLESIPEGLQRALDNWNSSLPEQRDRYIESGQSDVAELIQSEVTADDVIFAGDLDGWLEGIRNGTYNVGDVVAYDTGQGFYTVTVIRPYDVRTIRREQ